VFNMPVILLNDIIDVYGVAMLQDFDKKVVI
jgi:hypothetical protein